MMRITRAAAKCLVQFARDVCVYCVDGSSELWWSRPSADGESTLTWLGYRPSPVLCWKADHHLKRVTDWSQLFRIHGDLPDYYLLIYLQQFFSYFLCLLYIFSVYDLR